MPIKIKIGKRRRVISDFTITFVSSFLVAVATIFYGYLNYYHTPYFYSFVFLGVLAFTLPVGAALYIQYVRLRQKEYFFPQFLKDVADGVRAGLSLPQAVLNVTSINYGPLSEDVKRMAAQISWGLPFDEALKRFAERSGSKLIETSVNLILQAYYAGGNVADILETMSEDASKIHGLREERRTRFSGFIATLYAVYIIFLIIMVIITNSLLPEIPTMPSLSFGQAFGASANARKVIPEDDLRTVLLHLAIIEAIFSGVLAGIAGEGSAVAGIKHAIVLVFIGIATFQIFISVADPVDRIGRVVVKVPVNVESTIAVGKYFVTERFTVGDVLDAAKAYVSRTGLSKEFTPSATIVFVKDPSCTACAEGKVVVTSDAVEVLEPTYISITVKTDPEKGRYYVYIS